MNRYSNYIVYVDEYGDRDLGSTPSSDNIFIQNFCIFDKRHYAESVVPRLQALKFQYFGHDGVFFNVDAARGPNQQQQFIHAVNELIEHSNFVLISCIVDKHKQSDDNDAIFDQVLSFGLNHSYRFLQEREQTERLTYVVAMGKDADNDQGVRENFRQLCAQQKDSLPFELHLTEQQHRPLGIQFAALLAAPLIAHYRESDKKNPAFELLKNKFYCKGGRKQVGVGYEGWGLKVFA